MTDIRDLTIEQYIDLDGELTYVAFLAESLTLRAYQKQQIEGLPINEKSIAEDLHAMTELMAWHVGAHDGDDRLALFRVAEVDGEFTIEQTQQTRKAWNDLFNEAIHHKAMLDLVDGLFSKVGL